MIKLTLPYPPTVNTFYRHIVINGKPRTLISKSGRRYVGDVKSQVLVQHANKLLYGNVSVHIDVYVPDERKRDLDNIQKALLDSLTKSGVWMDDSQIIDLRIVKRGKKKGGSVSVSICEIS